MCREITRECKARGLRVPSRGTVLRRIARLDPVTAVSAREGADAARALRPAGGVPPEITGLLEQVQADHTPVDVIVVDERHRLPVGRPYVTAAIDVASRCVAGMVVTLEAPSATSVGLCLAHMAADKRAWLERLGVEAVWPMSGKPRELYVDNAAEFKSEALRRGCDQHGIRLRYRPPRPAALRRDRRAADRHDDADGARAAGHDVLQHRASAAATTATRRPC